MIYNEESRSNCECSGISENGVKYQFPDRIVPSAPVEKPVESVNNYLYNLSK